MLDVKTPEIPFLRDIHIFNETFHKPENIIPTIPENYQFILDTIQEELDEMKEAFQNRDIIEVADSLMDILYFVGNGILATGLSARAPQLWAEVQASNMSKVCLTEEDARQSVKYMEDKKKVPYYYREWKNRDGRAYWVVYRKSDDKAGKCFRWFEPNLRKFFTEEEIDRCSKD